MAERYIDGKLHRTEKVHRGTCTKCGQQICCGWQVSEVLAHTPRNNVVATYCYDCTGNNWATSFKLYREALPQSLRPSVWAPYLEDVLSNLSVATDWTDAEIVLAGQPMLPQSFAGTFRPNQVRLDQITAKGAELLDNADDEDLGLFSE